MAISTAKIATGVAGGYLLGRTKKLKLALTVAGLLAGKKLAPDPKALTSKIANGNPEIGQRLTGAAKELALATAASRVEAVTQRLGDVGGQNSSDDGQDKGEDRNESGSSKKSTSS